MNILLIDGHLSTHSSLRELFSENVVEQTNRASDALQKIHAKEPDCIILELALPGHSGLEFLYELRSYRDWMNIPVVIYSRIRMPERIVTSRAWQSLNVSAVLYKPESSLATLRSCIEKFGLRR